MMKAQGTLTLLLVPLTLVAIGVLGGCHDDESTAPPQIPNIQLTEGAEHNSDAPPAGVEPEVPVYVEGGLDASIEAATPVIRTYKDFNAWWGENRDHATLTYLGKVLGTDYFTHPMNALSAGIPLGTAVVLMTSNSHGWYSTRAAQNAATAQANLASYLAGGGVAIVDMGDNDYGGGYWAPGASGTPNLTWPAPCRDATLAPAAFGPDGMPGTADDHPIVKGPDGIPATGDDLTNSNIDIVSSCYVAHGNLADGITLPADATVLATVTFGGVQKPVLAEYCYQGRGRVILDTFTKEWYQHQGPLGHGSGVPSYLMINLFSYAMSPEAICVIYVDVDIKPGSDPNSINTKSMGVVPIAVLGSDEFDVTDIDVTTLAFGPNGAAPAHDLTDPSTYYDHLQDVNYDGHVDLVSHYRQKETGLQSGDTEACITGATTGGTPIEGCDAVRILK